MKTAEKIAFWQKWFDIWASGVIVQRKMSDKWIDILPPKDSESIPLFYVERTYRVKPREFKHGAFYPVERSSCSKSVKEIALYLRGDFFVTGIGDALNENYFTWIGEELKGDLWNT